MLGARLNVRRCGQVCQSWPRGLRACPELVTSPGRCPAAQPEVQCVQSSSLKWWASAAINVGLVVFLSGTLVLGAVYGAADKINEGIGTDR